jgi:predicted RNA-binding protein YlqC (UPF0109 family)
VWAGSDQNMKDLVEYIAKSLVDNPEAVDITEIEEDNSVIIELKSCT